MALGQLDEADALLAELPAEMQKDQAIERAKAALALARNAKPVADLSGSRRGWRPMPTIMKRASSWRPG